MRTNRIKELLAAGKVPVGHMVWEFKTRGIATIAESAGCDFIIVDMEHSGFDLDAVADILAWARHTNLTSVVRVPDLEYHFVGRCLDAGALGIMFPNVESAEEAKRAVEMVKYPPRGRRGAGLASGPPNPWGFLGLRWGRVLRLTRVVRLVYGGKSHGRIEAGYTPASWAGSRRRASRPGGIGSRFRLQRPGRT